MTDISTPLNVEEYLFTLKVGKREYTIDIKWLLNLKSAITEDQSDAELEDSLQKVAGYLHVFSSAYDSLNRERATYQLDYDIWYSAKFDEAEKELLKTFASEIASGARSKSMSSPTKTQVETYLINGCPEEYRGRNLQLSDLNTNADYLLREMKLIESRGTHLQTLIKSRQSIRNIE